MSEERDDPSGVPTPEEASTEAASDDVTEFTIGEKTYNLDEIKDVIEHHGTWNDMQAAHTQRSQALADERRAFEKEREEWQSRRQQQPQQADEDDDVVSRLVHTNQEILKRLDQQDQRDNDAVAQAQREDQMESSMAPYRNKPLFDEAVIRTYLDNNGLDHRHVGVAYNALFGYRLGESVGETKASNRYRAPVLGSTPSGISPGWTSPSDAPAARPSISETSWQDIERAAAEDQQVG